MLIMDNNQKGILQDTFFYFYTETLQQLIQDVACLVVTTAGGFQLHPALDHNLLYQ